jgi:hypothetical protein
MNDSTKQQRPSGWLALGIFFIWGAAMASIAGVTLIAPGTLLDRMWVLNPRGHAVLITLGKPVGFLFLLLALALAAAGVGWLKRRYWGWLLALLLIGGNALGDLIRLVSGAWLEGAVGVAIAGALVLYLLQSNVRGWFRPTASLEQQ